MQHDAYRRFGTAASDSLTRIVCSDVPGLLRSISICISRMSVLIETLSILHLP